MFGNLDQILLDAQMFENSTKGFSNFSENTIEISFEDFQRTTVQNSRPGTPKFFFKLELNFIKRLNHTNPIENFSKITETRCSPHLNIIHRPNAEKLQ